MYFKNSNFTISFSQIYIVQTTLLQTITVTTPSVSPSNMDASFICVNAGLGTLRFTGTNGETFNGSSPLDTLLQWGAYWWFTDGVNWYKCN